MQQNMQLVKRFIQFNVKGPNATPGEGMAMPVTSLPKTYRVQKGCARMKLLASFHGLFSSTGTAFTKLVNLFAAVLRLNKPYHEKKLHHFIFSITGIMCVCGGQLHKKC